MEVSAKNVKQQKRNLGRKVIIQGRHTVHTGLLMQAAFNTSLASSTGVRHNNDQLLTATSAEYYTLIFCSIGDYIVNEHSFSASHVYSRFKHQLNVPKCPK